MDVEGTLVGIARSGCPDRPVITLHDMAAGTSTELDLGLQPGHRPLELRMTGRYLALLIDRGESAWSFEIIVWDRDAGREHYRVDAGALVAGQQETGGLQTLALQPDGTVLHGMSMPGFDTPGMMFAWASAGEPALHRIPGEYLDQPYRHAAAGGMATVQALDGSGPRIIGFDGAIRNAFAHRRAPFSMDFDGTRIAWTDPDQGSVHNEAYPYTPPEEGDLFPEEPVGPGTHNPAPRATIGAMRSRLRARALRAFSGSAADPDDDVALVRVGLVRIAKRRCETLRKNGRLARTTLTRGTCVPTAWLNATGTTSWRLKLRRRLPRGRYVLYAQAMDAAGHTQSGFATRKFTLR